MSRGKQYRLSARCVCGAPVRMRNFTRAVELLVLAMERGHLDPDEVLQTYQCARILKDGELCNHLVEIKARHWYEAEA